MPRPPTGAREDAELIARIKQLIEQHPTDGYRRIWARLRIGDQRVINRKKVRRLMRQQGWLVCQRPTTPTPRVRRKKSVATRVNERWALDATHIDGGADGWGHLVAVIDGYDREIVGWECALRGRANEAERALEMACLARFGTLRPGGDVPIIRSDNGLIFQSRRFREACQFYRLQQEFITPYTPEQNGGIERWFRSLKEACVWHQPFGTFQEARQTIRTWIAWSQQRTAPPGARVLQSARLPSDAQCATACSTRSVLACGLARERSGRGRPSASPRRSRASLVPKEGILVV